MLQFKHTKTKILYRINGVAMIKNFKITTRIAKELYLQLKDEANETDKSYADYVRLKLGLSFKEVLKAIKTEGQKGNENKD